MPTEKKQSDLKELLARRHPEHAEFENRWTWEQDTLEGGERYRRATYGHDSRGLPQQNMIRYKRDYALTAKIPGADAAANASDSDFELRVARTPPPSHLEEAIGIHLSKIYKTDPEREGPSQLEAFWRDVDGRGTGIREWLEEAAPIFCCNAQLDVIVDHPEKPEGEIVNTRADEMRLGLTKAVLKYILPQNLLWWRLDKQDRYVECLVREPQDDGRTYYRHWTPTGWTLYSQEDGDESDGKVEIVAEGEHPFGRPPIERILHKRRHRCRNVGRNRYEAICELSRAHYNLDGELVLGDANQSHPTLQAPAELLANGVIQVGPSNVLPMLETQGATGLVTFTGWSYVDPPKGCADSLRKNKEDIRNEIDRIACLVKPAGATGTTGQTVSQSGVSKEMDQETGNALLSELSAALYRVDWTISALALLVLGDGNVELADLQSIEINYPKTFELASTATLAKTIEDYQGIIDSTGATPKVETQLIKRFLRVALPGKDPDTYVELDGEVTQYIEGKAETHEQEQEAKLAIEQAKANQSTPVAAGDAADIEDDPEP